LAGQLSTRRRPRDCRAADSDTDVRPTTADASQYQELVDWLTTKVAGYVNVPPDAISIDTPLADCGIDSISGLALCADLQCEKGFAVDTTIVWDYATIDAIAAYLVAERAAP